MESYLTSNTVQVHYSLLLPASVGKYEGTVQQELAANMPRLQEVPQSYTKQTG
jgi:hypothetical protein